MANKPLGFPFGFFTNDNTPIDGKYFNRETLLPYSDMAEALSLLPVGIRHSGLTININGIEYWWKPDWTDLNQNPVVKTIGVGTAPDGLLTGGRIDISDFDNGNIIVEPASWNLTIGGSQSVYSTTNNTTFSGIALSSSGNQRFIAFYGNNNNEIIKVEGDESQAAVFPTAPASAVIIGYTLVTDTTTEPPVVDLSGYAKLVGGNNFSGNQNITGNVKISNYLESSTSVSSLQRIRFSKNIVNYNDNFVLDTAAIRFINHQSLPTGGLNVIGVSGAATLFFYVRNDSVANVIINHRSPFVSSTQSVIICPNNTDYTLKPGEIVQITGVAVENGSNAYAKEYYIASSSQYGVYKSFLDEKEDKSNKGIPDGYASLDGNGTVPISQLPDSLFSSMKYGGGYDGTVITASASFPELEGQPLPNAEDYEGLYLISTADYTYNGVDYFTGDWILSNGVEWTIVRNTDAVRTVFGRTGDVVITPADVNLTNNRVLSSNNSGNFEGLLYSNNTVASTLAFRDSNARLKAANAVDNIDLVPLGQMNTALALKEDLSNKVTSLSSPNNTTYPTTQAVVTAISSSASTKQTITLSQADLLQDTNNIWYLPYSYTEDIVPVHILYNSKTLLGWQLDRTFTPARLYGFVDNSTATIKLTLI